MKTALALSFTGAVVLASISGCGLIKSKDADAGADAGETLDAATVTVTGTGAKNEANILRYASETPLANEQAVIAKDGTVARNFPGNGPEVATLAKGTAVAKIAQYFSTATLVMFDDPGDGTKLLGWVMPTAFDLAAPLPVKPVVVPPRVVVTDGGARPVDGGTSDAGMLVSSAAGDAGVKKDAGAASLPPAPPRGAASSTPVDGKCPDGWLLVGGTCRSKCNSDADCAKPLRCIGKRGAGKMCIP